MEYATIIKNVEYGCIFAKKALPLQKNIRNVEYI